MPEEKPPREGELYRNVSVGGHLLELYYGYYEDGDRANSDPVVLYPDFFERPLFTGDGHPLVSAVQQPCEHYRPPAEGRPEECCSDCSYYPDSRAEIAVCQCPAMRRKAALKKSDGSHRELAKRIRPAKEGV